MKTINESALLQAGYAEEMGAREITCFSHGESTSISTLKVSAFPNGVIRSKRATQLGIKTATTVFL